MIRRRMQTVIGWLQSILLFSIIGPILYTITLDSELCHMGRVYMLCLMIAIPIVLTDLIIHRSRSLLVYIMLSIGVSAVTAAVTVAAGGRIMEDGMGAGAAVIVTIETVYVVLERLLIRLNEKKECDKGGENPDWRPRLSLLVQPEYYILLLFGFAYLAGLFFSGAALCNIALGSMVSYLLLTVLYQYLVRTKEYLSLNKRVCNLPVRRLYGISASACVLFLFLLLTAGIVAGMTAGMRDYKDLRSMTEGVETVDFEIPFENQPIGPEQDFGAEMLGIEEPAEPPAWVEPVTYVICVSVLLCVLWLCILEIRHIGRLFRETYDENGDVVEEIEAADEAAERIRPQKRRSGKMSRREEIRRRYRREIRRHRKEKPAPCESPYEIEQNAGIAETEEGKTLHLLYEDARYGLPKPEDMSS